MNTALLKPALASVKKKITRAAVLYPLFFLPKQRKIELERWLRGREQFQKLQAADVVIVSFGKSGRTWLRVMLSRFFQLKHEISERYLIGFDNFHVMCPDVPKVFFTHDNYTKDYTGNRDNKVDYYGKKVILLVRDPADVAVSQYHQWRHRMKPGKKALNDYPDHGQDVPIYDFVVEEKAGLEKAIDFLNGWANEQENLRQFLIVRYEDMRSDPKAELARMTNFMGAQGTAEQVVGAVDYASFDNMKKLEQKSQFWLSGGRMMPKDKSNPESFKVRRGKVGGWRDYFSVDEAKQIEAEIDRSLSPIFGYGRMNDPVRSTG